MYDVELRILPLPHILLAQYVWRSKPFAALQKLQKILYIQNMSYIADALLCTKWVFELQFTKNHFSFGFDLCDNNNIATFCATNAMYLIITSIIFMCNMSCFMTLIFLVCVFVCVSILPPAWSDPGHPVLEAPETIITCVCSYVPVCV